MNKFVEEYKKVQNEFNIEERVYKGRCMVCDAISDEKKRLKELEKYKSDYFTAVNIFDAAVSDLNEEIIRCGYLIRLECKNKVTSLEILHVGGFESDERTFIIDDSVTAVISENGLIKYVRNQKYSWNVCYAMDAGFDICDKDVFDKWIKTIKEEFDKNIG